MRCMISESHYELNIHRLDRKLQFYSQSTSGLMKIYTTEVGSATFVGPA